MTSAQNHLQQLNGSNMKILTNLLVGLVLFGATQVYAQDFQAEYLEAKRQFKLGNFKVAKDAFEYLSQPANGNEFVQYARFYKALSEYSLEEYSDAKNSFLAIKSTYPNWEQLPEVDYWLTSAYFKLDAFELGSQLVTDLQRTPLRDHGTQLRQSYLDSLDTDELGLMYETTPADKQIAVAYANRLKEGNLSDNQDLLLQIMVDHNLDIKDFVSQNYENVIKDSYNIAVLFPFRFDGYDKATLVMRNRLVMDLYEGIMMGVQRLNSNDGPAINVYPYDTKGLPTITKEILEKPELKSMDLIIGPLFPGPFKEVYDFSIANKINMFNPISSNESVIGSNPFSFLRNATVTTQARKIAQYVNENQQNKTAWVLYDDKNADLAEAYKAELEKNDFTITRHQKLTRISSREILDTLNMIYEVEIPEDELDSVEQDYPDLVIKSKRKRGSTDRYSYFEKYLIDKDSIGHIFLATNSNLFAPSYVSTIITRPDTISLVGLDKWMEMDVISPDQMENIGLILSDPQHVNRGIYAYDETFKAFMDTYKTIPSLHHFIGMESIIFLGEALRDYGKYFQEGLRKGEYRRGFLMPGFEYGLSNDNQVVPLVRVEDSKIIQANPRQ